MFQNQTQYRCRNRKDGMWIIQEHPAHLFFDPSWHTIPFLTAPSKEEAWFNFYNWIDACAKADAMVA